MKIFSLIRSFFDPDWRTRPVTDEDRLRWRRDPLSHPDLDAMSLRELADIPFCPGK